MKNTNAMTLANSEVGTIGVADYKQKKFEVEGRMIKTLLILFILVVSTLHVSAQKTVVLDAFSKHGIDAGILSPANLQEPDDYAFDFRQTTIAANKTTVTIAKFDPSGPKEEQWTVISVNGKSPSKGDISSFRKNKVKEGASGQADDASYKIEKESADYLVVSYKPNATTVSKDAAFMKDCRLYMTINLKSCKLEQVQALNEKPLKIKILNAEKLDLITKYSYNGQAKRYFPVNEDLNIQAKFMGQAVNVQTVTERSNFTKK